MNKKRLFCSVLIFMNLSTSVLAATTVTDVNSINNDSDATYKTTKEDLQKIANTINYKSRIMNLNNFSEEVIIKDESQQESWLLENKILSKDLNLETDNTSVNSSLRPSYYTKGSTVGKSDLVMAMSKIFYGVQESRPVVIKTKNPVTYELDPNNIKNYLDRSEGNYNVYVTPNVYELYFSTLLNKGMLRISDFKDLDFINEYNDLSHSTKPSWSRELGTFNMSKINLERQLGSSIKLEYRDSDFYSEYVQPNYFIEEDVDTIDAYKILEEFLRIEEKDLTEEEAKIITYKYGVDRLQSFDEESKKTLMFMIAKGIINFEDESEFKNLFSPLDKDTFIRILYRTANKNARLDFSKVQLTDNDNYWLSKGMYESTLTFIEDKEQPEISGDVELLETKSANLDNNKGLIKNRKITLQGRNQGNKYKVTRNFKPFYNFTYKGQSLDTIKGKFEEVESFESMSTGGQSGPTATVSFIIFADSPVMAAAIVDNRITNNSSSVSVTGKVPSIVQVSSGGTQEYFVPKSMLEEIGSNSKSELVALDDKILMNKDTGVRAVLLENNKMALIGNEVIDTDSNMVTGANGEVYYNFKVIMRLMSTVYINQIRPNEIYRFESGTFGETLEEIYPELTSASSDSSLDKAMTYKFSGVRKSTSPENYNDPSYQAEKSFFSCVQTTNSFSYLYKDISKELGWDDLKYPVYLFVDWNYVIPYSTSTSLNSTELKVMKDMFENSGNPSVSSMSRFLNTRPYGAELSKWWDSNIGLSDALCNLIYGSSGAKYFSSGYMTPSVYILARDTLDEEKQNKILDLIPLASDYKSKFVTNGSISKSLFGIREGVYGELQASREYAYLEGFNHPETGGTEYSDFLLDKSDTLYRSFNDPYSEYEYAEHRLQYRKESGINKLRLRSRTATNLGNYNIRLKQEYTFNGKKYLATEERTVNGKVCVALTALDPVEGYATEKVNGTNNQYITWFKGDRQSIESNGTGTQVLDVVKDLCKTSGSSDGIVIGDVADHVTGYPAPLGYSGKLPEDSTDSTLFRVNDFSSDNNNKSQISVAWKKESGEYFGSYTECNTGFTLDRDRLYGENVVNYYPVILLEKFSWYSDNDGVLSKSPSLSFFMRENLRNVGVANAVIDSTIDYSYGYTSMSGIKEGAKVIIGDLTFTYSKGKLTSSPMTGTDLVSRLWARADSQDAVLSELSKLFDGCNINLIKDGSVLSSGALCDYIPKDDNGNYQIDLSYPSEGKGLENSEGTLVKKNGNLYIVTKGKEKSYDKSSSFSEYVFSVVFDKNIKFRPIDFDKNTWSICYTSNSQTDGYMSDVPYFNESLGYKWYDDAYNTMLQTKYKEAEDASGLMDKLKAYFDAQFRKDIYGLMKMFVIIVCLYLWVMSFCVYIMKAFLPTMLTVLERINNPNNGTNKGFDIIKFITLGTYAIDREITFIHFVGFQMLLTIVIAVFWTFV